MKPSLLRARRVVSAGAAMAAALALVTLGAAAPASAAGESLNVIVQQVDGTANFDALDADGSNGIVRTNDTIAYTVSVRSEGGAQTAPTISFTLPQGQELTTLPAYCLAGSSVVPASIPAATPPLTSTSWQSLPTQTVTCVLADRGAAPSTIDYVFVAKARSEVPNGTTLDPFDATATSTAVSDGGTISDTSNEVQVTVVSEPVYDLGKNGMSSTGDNSGYVHIGTGSCTVQSFIDAGFVGCQLLQFPVLISVQPGAKGSAPLAGDITFVDDLRPDSFWGAGTTSEAGWDADFGPALAGCGTVTSLDNGASFFPYGSGGGTNAVVQSGAFSCTVGATGEVGITISGADTTARTYPSTNGTMNVAVPADRAYVVSGWIRVEYPTAALSAIGNASSSGSSELPFVNTYTDLEGTDLSGQPLPDEANLANNTRGGTATVRLPGPFAKFFVGEPGNAANAGGSGYAAGAWAGPPGSSSLADGNGIVQPGGRVLSGISTTLNSPAGFGSVTQVICDVWDSSRVHLTADDWEGRASGTTPETSGYFQNRVSGGAAVWRSSELNATGTEVYTYEYSAGTPGASAANACVDDTSAWYSSPAAVPGNDPTLAASGIYTGVTAVRITIQVDKPVASDLSAVYNFEIGLTVADSVATGDRIGNWSATKTVRSDTATAPTAATAVATASTEKTVTTYVPGNHTGVYGDRVTVQAVVARLLKEVRDSASGDFTSTTVPRYTSGIEVDYRLTPTVTAGMSTGAAAATIVEDCLPEFQTFVSSVHEDGTPLSPEVVATSGPEFACEPGETYIRWNLGDVPINSTVSPIVYTVYISAATPTGIYTNTAIVTAAGDASSAAQRDDDQGIQIEAPVGLRLDKTTPLAAVEVNPSDATTPRTLDWQVDFTAIDTDGVSNVDIIDVLPSDGLGGSSFTGSVELSAAAVSTTAGTARVLYTAAAPGSVSLDPEAASNGASGATVWCDAHEGGAVVLGNGTAADCPDGTADVTALRVLQSGAFPSNSLLRLTVSMIPLGNVETDVYVNVTQADATGVLQGVGPVERAITAIASSIGDYVWLDDNRNGIQDAGETGVEGMPVTLSGTDSLGNAITGSTVTDANGLYTFDNLPSGTYTVTFDRDWAAERYYAFTLLTAGSDPTVDSDAIPASGSTAPFALGVDTDIIDIDAGLVFNGPVSIDIEKEVCLLPDNSCSPTAAAGTGGWSTDGVAGIGPDTEVASIPFGGTVLWRIIVTNTGEETLTDVSVTDPEEPLGDRDATDIPSFDELLPGESESWTFTTTNLTEDITPNTASVTGTSLDDPTITVTDEDSANAVVARAELSISKVIVDDNPGDGNGDAATFPVTVTCTLPDDSELELDIDLPRDGTPVVVEVPVGSVCEVVETDTDGGTVTYSIDGEFELTDDLAVTVTNTYRTPPSIPGLALTGLSVGAGATLAGGLLTAGLLLAWRRTKARA